MAVIHVPRECADGETRVAAIPETVKGMAKLGLQVQVERGAGGHAGFSDADYQAAGATLVDAAARSAADLVLGVQCPPPDAAKANAGDLARVTYAADGADTLILTVEPRARDGKPAEAPLVFRMSRAKMGK